jgi:hypothetical protein
MYDNYVYNHIGHFAAANEAFCKALVIGGVVQRFPGLRFAFLEGGVGWACSLYNDLIEHWETRNLGSMREHLDPALLDRAELAEWMRKYGDAKMQQHLESMVQAGDYLTSKEEPEDLDDFRALKIADPREFADIFSRFYFGCEGEDRMTAVAFNPKLNHFGAKIQPIFGSDVGHFDVRDLSRVLAEAYELVEDELISEADFREFTFGNVAKMFTSMNPEFFAGTSVEDAVKRELGAALA